MRHGFSKSIHGASTLLVLLSAFVYTATGLPSEPAERVAKEEEVHIRDDAHWRSLWKEWLTPNRVYLFAPGEYSSIHLVQKKGNQAKNITLKAADEKNKPVVICRDGKGRKSTGIRIVDFENVAVENFIIRDAGSNGLAASDGDAGRLCKGLALRGLEIQDIGSQFSNHDAIKLTHVTDFSVEDCVAKPGKKAWGWGQNGSGIDMVSCHRGLVQGNYFECGTQSTKGQGVQCKGGSSEIVIRHNRFYRCGRALGLGGGDAKGTDHFLPPPKLPAPSALCCIAEENLISECGAAAMVQNSTDCVFRKNLVLSPTRWGISIWSPPYPNIAPAKGFVAQENVFVHQLDDAQLVHSNPERESLLESFCFSENWWFGGDDGAKKPLYPGTPEIRSEVYGIDPKVRVDDWPHSLPERRP